jgi:hypothetical protein
MATAGIFNGTDLKVYIVDTTDKPIAHATSCEISFTHSPRECTTKDSGGDTDRLPGKRDCTISVEALYAEDVANATKRGIIELFTALKNGTALSLKFSTKASGDKIYAVTGYLTDLSINAGTEENASYSATFAGSGAFTIT